jgi:hypothetical protein
MLLFGLREGIISIFSSKIGVEIGFSGLIGGSTNISIQAKSRDKVVDFCCTFEVVPLWF